MTERGEGRPGVQAGEHAGEDLGERAGGRQDTPRAPGEQSLVELVELDPGALDRLHRLMGWWGMLADLSFADLLLLVPLTGGGGSQFLIYGQMRPSTNQTLHREDQVGRVVDATEWPRLSSALRLGEITDEEPVACGQVGGHSEKSSMRYIPVGHGGSSIAVVVRETAFDVGRRTGELERVYLELFDRFAEMILDGVFPFPVEELATDEVATDDAPRVSDGIAVLDVDGKVSFVSPNAISALHRMGVYSSVVGHRLDELGVDESAVERSFAKLVPVIEEVERRPDVIVLLRCIPLLSEQKISGGVVLLRDVTDLRHRDRLLLSKDATIREVHHRVKNNLQTISSLLGLQQRRLTSEEGRDALREAETRIRSIAVVHEILSREAADQVRFEEIVKSLVRMAEESVVAPHPVRIQVEGDLGELGADVATPLAVVLTELLQNAVEHAFDYVDGEGPGTAVQGLVWLRMERAEGTLRVEVRDNGRGLPENFDIERTGSLGLLIVRDLVTSQLLGSIEMRGDAEGTAARLSIPLEHGVGS